MTKTLQALVKNLVYAYREGEKLEFDPFGQDTKLSLVIDEKTRHCLEMLVFEFDREDKKAKEIASERMKKMRKDGTIKPGPNKIELPKNGRELWEEVRQLGISRVARDYGVSRGTVKNRMKNEGLEIEL